MASIDVPIYLYTEHTAIADALRRLRQISRGGLLMQDETGYRLLFAGDLLRARSNGITTVQSVPGGEPVMEATEELAAVHNLDLGTPHRTLHQFQKMMDQYKRSYTVPLPRVPRAPQTSGEMFNLVTRSEHLEQMLRMTGGYECDGAPKHFFPKPYVSAGDDCPRYPECSRTDGTVPKVIASI